LESVLSIYFSNCRHKERAAFILCDELIEVTCREKVKLRHRTLGRIDFHGLVTHAEIAFDVTVPGIGTSICDCHNTRNDLQHNNPAGTVDSQHCADAIVDAVEVIEHCFPGAKAALPDKLKVTIRVVRLLSQHGDPHQQTEFGDAMRTHPWRGNRERARQDEVIVTPGPRGELGTRDPVRIRSCRSSA
jgi:hypothetical protein